MGPTTWFPSTTPTAMRSPAARTPISSPIVSCLKSAQLIQAVERGRFVAFRQGRVIEHRVHEIVHRPLEGQNRLADVHQFGRPFSYDMHAEDLLSLAMENQLEPPRGVSANLTAR